MKKYRQKEFDFFIKELLNEGVSLIDADLEAVQAFNDLNYDLSLIVRYPDQNSFELKNKIEKNINTIENCSEEKDSLINLNFSLQGLENVLKEKSNIPMILKIIEGRDLFHILLKSIQLTLSDEKSIGSFGEDEELDDSNCIIRERIYSFLNKLFDLQSFFIDFGQFITINSTEIPTINLCIEEDSLEIE